MNVHSAGILVYRTTPAGVEVLIVHPGGPFWAKKDTGAWSITKGEFAASENPQAAARREFQEEVGAPAPPGELTPLGESAQKSGKIVHAFAVSGDFNLEYFKSNMFTMEWPPRSGVQQEFPECDRAAWTPLQVAHQKLVPGQAVFIERLAQHLGIEINPPSQTSLL